MAPPLLPTLWQHERVRPAAALASLYLRVRLLAPACAIVAAAPLDAAEGAERPPEVVYLHLSDGSLTLTQAARDDATQGRSVVGAAAPYPAFSWSSSGEDMPSSVTTSDVEAYLLARLHRAFLPYNILWTVHRPAQGQYTMVVVGGGPGVFRLDGRVAGVAFQDCGNAVPSNVVFAFPQPVAGNLHGLFVTIAQETGHAFGLEHTTDDEDLMHPRLHPRQVRFTDRTTPVDGPRVCGPALQNSHRALLAAVGSWPPAVAKPLADGAIPDVAAPRVRIVNPAPGARVRSPVALDVNAQDESGVASMQYQALGQVERVPVASNGGSHSFTLPPGRVTLTAFARDPSGNWGHDSVDVVVVDDEDTGCAYAGGASATHALPRGWHIALFAAFAAICGARACRRARR